MQRPRLTQPRYLATALLVIGLMTLAVMSSAHSALALELPNKQVRNADGVLAVHGNNSQKHAIVRNRAPRSLVRNLAPHFVDNSLEMQQARFHALTHFERVHDAYSSARDLSHEDLQEFELDLQSSLHNWEEAYDLQFSELLGREVVV